MSGRQRWLPLVAPAALLALALSQLALVAAAGLSPWKGGGFGMFSTNDHGGFRTLRAWAATGGEERRLPIPEALRRDALRARELPTERRLERLARALAREAPEADALRVEVWRLDFDAALSPSLSLLARATARP